MTDVNHKKTLVCWFANNEVLQILKNEKNSFLTVATGEEVCQSKKKLIIKYIWGKSEAGEIIKPDIISLRVACLPASGKHARSPLRRHSLPHSLTN